MVYTCNAFRMNASRKLFSVSYIDCDYIIYLFGEMSLFSKIPCSLEISKIQDDSEFVSFCAG